MIQYYYAETLRSITNSLLERFTHLQVNRYNKARTAIVKTIDVPIAFAPVEKTQQDRLEDYSAEPESTGQRYYMQVPRLALVFNGFSYAPDRATSVNEYRYFQGQDSQHLNTVFKDIQPSPWNFTYTLFVRTDSISDFSQIIENILPYFNPKLYLRVKEFSFLNIERDLAVVLNDATPEFTDELDKNSMRQINGSITFTVEGWIYKPVDSAKLVKLIRTRYFFEGERAKDTLMDENGVTHTPANVTVNVGAPMTVSLTPIQPSRVIVVTGEPPLPITETLNAIVWDGSRFIIVGDNGVIATTVDGNSPMRISVPTGVSSYKLTGIAHNSGVYVVAGTKTISAGNYRLLILTSTDAINWIIDTEMDFASNFDPAIAFVSVLYGNSEFVINGAALQYVKGNPGSWSLPLQLQHFESWLAISGMVYKDNIYYVFFVVGSCVGGEIMLVRYDASFAYIDQTSLPPPYYGAGWSEKRGAYFYDDDGSWVFSYKNINSNKIEISQSPTWNGTWTKEVEVTSPLTINDGIPLSTSTKKFIVGGDGTTTGVVYKFDSVWTDITSGQVSLNAIAFNGSSLALAVGYQAAIVPFTP